MKDLERYLLCTQGYFYLDHDPRNIVMLGNGHIYYPTSSEISLNKRYYTYNKKRRVFERTYHNYQLAVQPGWAYKKLTPKNPPRVF